MCKPQISRLSKLASRAWLPALILNGLAMASVPPPTDVPAPAARQDQCGEEPKQDSATPAQKATKAPHSQALKPRLREFPSKDGLVLTADLYMPNKHRKAPLIVLFHQANWSRGEYREIAPKLCALGYNCMAVDLRSGKEVNEVINESAKRAQAAELGTEYVDALQDMEAALLYARKHLTQGKIIAWGSSYSSALALHLAGTQPKLMDGVLSFAPGEYFEKKGEAWIQTSAKKIACPTFVTSAKHEHPRWEAIFEAIPTKTKRAFVPETKGQHGSRALWAQFDDSAAYWKEVQAFLKEHFPVEEASQKH